jgi:hypothetical protein
MAFASGLILHLKFGRVLGLKCAAGNAQYSSANHMFNNFIYGAAPLAPLLFPNLMLLALIGIWQLRLKFSGPRDDARFTSQTP